MARFPDVLTVTKAEEDLESVAADLCAVLDDALAAYNRHARRPRARRLAADIGSRLDTIEHITGMVEERSPQTVAEYRAQSDRQDGGGPAIDHHRREPAF